MTISPCNHRPANCCAVKLRWNAAPAQSISERESSPVWLPLDSGKSFCQGQRGAGEPTCEGRASQDAWGPRRTPILPAWCSAARAVNVRRALRMQGAGSLSHVNVVLLPLCMLMAFHAPLYITYITVSRLLSLYHWYHSWRTVDDVNPCHCVLSVHIILAQTATSIRLINCCGSINFFNVWYFCRKQREWRLCYLCCCSWVWALRRYSIWRQRWPQVQTYRHRHRHTPIVA